jgi:hypothetical protein
VSIVGQVYQLDWNYWDEVNPEPICDIVFGNFLKFDLFFFCPEKLDHQVKQEYHFNDKS